MTRKRLVGTRSYSRRKIAWSALFNYDFARLANGEHEIVPPHGYDESSMCSPRKLVLESLHYLVIALSLMGNGRAMFDSLPR